MSVTEFDGRQTFKTKILLITIDRLNVKLRKRIAYQQVWENFDFLKI